MNDLSIFNNVSKISTLDEKQIQRIVERLPEYKKGKSMIGHSTSQTSYSLQTLQMISDSPLSRMKQCLAQINKKYEALQEHYFKIERKKLLLEKLSNKNDAISRLTIAEYQSHIENITIKMNTTLREIGMFQDMYDSIKKNNNIRDDWDERDYEKQEIGNMIKSSFRIAIQDLSQSGRVSRAAVEFWEQLGIHPQVAEVDVRDYMTTTQQRIVNGDNVTIIDMYNFIDQMVLKYMNCYKDALDRMGLDRLGLEEFIAAGKSKPR